jgi:hypothetical protein
MASATAFDPLNIIESRQWTKRELASLVRALCRHTAGYEDHEHYGAHLSGIHIDAGAAVATDTTRVLVVKGFAGTALDGKTFRVIDRYPSPALVDDKSGRFPAWRTGIENPRGHKYKFEVSSLSRFRRLHRSKSTPLFASATGLSFQWSPGVLRAIDLRLLADLPCTDDVIILSFGASKLGPVTVQPAGGGWLASIACLSKHGRSDGIVKRVTRRAA